MAIWYTDNLTGNDTTGDGTIATPYKSINKAMTIGTNGDEIRVAGSGFTALEGTVTSGATTNTTWLTSVSQVGILVPGDIITLDDKEFGDQKFFYKVQTITATQITVDGYWNRTPNGLYNLSKITQKHYYTSTANVVFENISIAGKTDFKITGGWVDSYTAQTGWTVMGYQGGAQAQSGTAFTAPNGGVTGAVYLDRFMLSHLNTGVTASTNRWYQGTFAIVYFLNSNPLGGNSTTLHPYGPTDFYLTNSTRITAYSSATHIVDGKYPSQYRNVYQSVGVPPIISSSLSAKITNMYYKSSASGGGIVNVNGTSGNYVNVDNVYIQTQQPNDTNEYITLMGIACSVNNDIEIVGDNATTASLLFSLSVQFSTITLSTKKVEDFKLFSRGSLFTNVPPNVRIIDIEGDKQGFNLGNVAFADSTVFDTGSNSLRLSKTISDQTSRMPINVFFNANSVAKTITIRAKASSAVNATFTLNSNAIVLSTIQSEAGISYKPQVFALTTDWQDLVYTQLDATTSNILLKSWVSINVITDIAADYIWIDSVTIS